MGAGRPYNSTTPAWRSKPAIKVRMYHFLCYMDKKTPNKYDCAKTMKDGFENITVIDKIPTFYI